MPKLKTKSSVKKRFKVTKNGKVKSAGAFTSHMMQNKPKSMKRKSRNTQVLSKENARTILKNWMPYARKKLSKLSKTSGKGEA
ncbi:MAG: 50S ribosomal protein L35 [Micavibrio sp.]|nr:50S ribosomal protein L35 [Micavibrio sp.]